MRDRPPHRELRPLLFSISAWVLLRPTELIMKSCETGLMVYRPYPWRLESLTSCRCHYKGNMKTSKCRLVCMIVNLFSIARYKWTYASPNIGLCVHIAFSCLQKGLLCQTAKIQKYFGCLFKSAFYCSAARCFALLARSPLKLKLILFAFFYINWGLTPHFFWTFSVAIVVQWVFSVDSCFSMFSSTFASWLVFLCNSLILAWIPIALTLILLIWLHRYSSSFEF